MHILVTGSEGFIGSVLVEALHQAGHEVTGLDIRPATGGKQNYRLIPGNILDREVLKPAMEGVDGIIHLAAEHKDDGIPEELYFEVNVDGTQLVLEAATEYEVNKFVLFSSAAVYGQPGRATEEASPSPTNPYGVSKLRSEAVLRTWVSENSAREAVILRPTAVFGPNNYANLYRLISRVCEGRFLWIGRGNNIKSVAYVENLIAATLYLLGRMECGIQIYNYSDYPLLRMKQLVDLIAKKAGVQVNRRHIPYPLALMGAQALAIWSRIGGQVSEITVPRVKKFCMHTEYPTDKLRALGFRQKYTLEQGLEKTVQWYLSCRGQVTGTQSCVAETQEGFI